MLQKNKDTKELQSFPAILWIHLVKADFLIFALFVLLGSLDYITINERQLGLSNIPDISGGTKPSPWYYCYGVSYVEHQISALFSQLGTN